MDQAIMDLLNAAAILYVSYALVTFGIGVSRFFSEIFKK